MLDTLTIQTLAAELDAAQRSRVQVEQFSKRFPQMTVDDGYAIQQAWVAMECANGKHRVGHKIGLTSRAMQMASQIDEPDFGTLLNTMVFAPGQIAFEHFIAPMAEVELAFVLHTDIAATPGGPPVTQAQVLASTAYVVAAIELIDARIERFDRHTKAPRKVFDTISDNAANAGIILGSKRVKPFDVNLPWQGAILQKNGVVEETGLAAGVLGHPANGIVWLANKLAAHGQGLKAGEILLAGSFTRPVPAKEGDVFRADYGPVFGRIDFSFE